MYYLTPLERHLLLLLGFVSAAGCGTVLVLHPTPVTVVFFVAACVWYFLLILIITIPEKGSRP